jgi:hypothetical protein
MLMMVGMVMLAAGSSHAAGPVGSDILSAVAPAAAAAVGAGAAPGAFIPTSMWNPASLAGVRSGQITLSHFASVVDTAYQQLDAVLPVESGSAFGVSALYGRTYDYTSDPGAATGEPIDNYDFLISATYARDLGQDISLGVGMKAFESALLEYRSRGAAVDAGIQYRTFWQPLSLGASVQNIGFKSAFIQEREGLPLTARVGTSILYKPLAGQQAGIYLDGVWSDLDEAVSFAGGIEYLFYDTLVLRGGYRNNGDLGQLSAGLGFRGAHWQIDYAYQPYGVLGNTNRLSVSYRFE